MVEKILNNTTPYGKIRASHEGSLHSSTLKDSSGGVLNDASPSTVTTEAVDPGVNEGIGKSPAFIIEDNDTGTEYRSVSLSLDARVSQRIRDRIW